MDIREVLIAPRSPWQKPFIERVIGSIRRECLDHVIIFNEESLRRTFHFLFPLLPRFAPSLVVGEGFADPTCSSIRWSNRCDSSSRRASPSLRTTGSLKPIETRHRHLSRGMTILRLLTCSSPPTSASTDYFKVTQFRDWNGRRKCSTAKRYFSSNDWIIGRDRTSCHEPVKKVANCFNMKAGQHEIAEELFSTRTKITRERRCETYHAEHFARARLWLGRVHY